MRLIASYLLEFGPGKKEDNITNEELRHAQEELAESRAQYLDLYENAPVGCIGLDDRGVISFANRKAGEYFGLSQDKVAGESLSRFIFEADQNMYYFYRRRLADEDSSAECELRIRNVDGAVMWVLLESSSERRGTGTAEWRIVMHDIHAKMQAEAFRVRNSRWLNAVSDGLGVVFVETDTSGTCTDVSASVADVLGRGKELVGRDVFGT